MKAVKIATVILIITVLAVLINSFIISGIIKKYESQIERINSEDSAVLEKYEKAYEDFKVKKDYISLTVSHEDLTSIEDSFSGAIGAARSKNSDELEIIKSRLLDALHHLRRLVGINLDSIL